MHTSIQETLPTRQPTLPIKSSSDLFRLYYFPLQHRILDDILAVLWPDTRQPDALRGAFLPFYWWLILNALLAMPLEVPTAVNDHVRGVLVATDMADEVDADATGPLIVEISVQPEGT
jgi:hypothetical protein